MLWRTASRLPLDKLEVPELWERFLHYAVGTRGWRAP